MSRRGGKEAKRRACRRRPRSAKRHRLRQLIAERDGWTCWLCGNLIDPTVPHDAKAGATLDHVLAMEDGGGHDLENLRLAHRRCNWARHHGKRAVSTRVEIQEPAR